MSEGGVHPIEALSVVCLLVLGCSSASMTGKSLETGGMRLLADSSISCDTLVGALRLPPDAAKLVRQSLERHGGTVVRWPADRMPLKVWIQSPPALMRADVPQSQHQSGDWTWAITSALDHWSGNSYGFGFALTRDSAAADIHVTWVLSLPPIPEAQLGRSAGRSAVVREASTGAIVAAQLMLAELDRQGRRVSPDDVHVVAGHEIGHVLGLGHQQGALSVMEAAVRIDGTTSSDRAAVLAWYSLPLGRACRAGAGQ